MYGTSGGALTGCLLFLDVDLDALAEYVYICATRARASWRGAFLLRCANTTILSFSWCLTQEITCLRR